MPEPNLFAEGRKQLVDRLRAIADGLEGGTMMLVPNGTSIHPHLTQTAAPHGAKVQNGYFRLELIFYDPSQDMTDRVKPAALGGMVDLKIDDGTLGHKEIHFGKD